MKTGEELQAAIIRTERGLTIAGTRMTLYMIMDCLKAEWPPKLIQDSFNLTEKQVADAMKYIESHQEKVEAEYHEVLQQAEEIRAYWEEQNRERLAKIAALPPRPGKEALISKLKSWKMKLEKAA